YRALYGRISFALEGPDFTRLPTDERRAQFASNRADVRFCELLFHYSRYLLIAGGAPGSHALNLQGLWNDSFTPPWESIYTININIEMIYWPVYPMNLPELTGPLHEMIQKMREPGRRAAQRMYGCRGFVGHHNTNLWGDCAPNGAGVYQWPFGAAWLCLHLMEYHRFFGDVEFVRKEAYPLLRDAALFFLDYLQEDKDGYLVTNLTQSPENRYRLPDGQEGMIARTCTMDDAILCALFDDFLEAEALLGISDAFSGEVRAARGKIRPYRIGSKGQLLEWAEEHEEVEPGHRHFSHLFALHPGRQITPEATPELAQACRQTLALRMAHGSGHTGWSRAWMISHFARLHEGDMAWMHAKELAVSSLYPNLMAAHPPFQMDGNSGYAAGIVEMLVQSHEGMIRLMPGAFTTLPDGRIEGIRARGGFILDLTWRNGKPSSLRLLATRDQPCRLSAPIPFKDTGDCAWSGELVAGETREFVFAEA
ncbi:MAG TPA: glycoside hydrolase family 95 protein, partial [Clostridia bacterium]|nr:glycoside hydrolase family 95 protein [Clostridia bacterium]